MVLGHDSILAELEAGNILINPFVPENVNGASVDLRLGNWLIREDTGVQLLDTRSTDSGFSYPVFTELGSAIILKPGEFALASTLEEAGTTTASLQWYIKARSSSGRWGLDVCRCAGSGDPGFASFVTLELRNNRSADLVIYVGDRIAQMEFHTVEGNGYLYSKHYNAQGGEWHPGLMLPKALRRYD